MRKSVVFPAPSGPMNPKSSPEWTSNESVSSAGVFAKPFVTPSTETAGVPVSPSRSALPEWLAPAESAGRLRRISLALRVGTAEHHLRRHAYLQNPVGIGNEYLHR